MLAQEFLYQLSLKLHALAPQEREVALSYYAELISDKMENGESEQDIVASFGDIDQLAQTILMENNVYVAPKKKPLHPAIIVALIIGSPLIFALCVAGASVIFSLLVAAFTIAFSFLAVALALTLAGILAFFTSFILITSNPILTFMQIGSSFIVFGLAIFFALGGFYIGKGVFSLTSQLANKIKHLFTKRGN